MFILYGCVLQLVLATTCLGQLLQDRTIPSARAAQLFCYVDGSAYHITGAGAFSAADIDPELCTHIVYAFGTLENDHIAADDDDELINYRATVALKDKNPNLKVLFSIGGNNMGPKPFLSITNTTSQMNKFVQDGVAFLKRYKFDGLEISWQYPESEEIGEKLVNLLKSLKESFEKEAKNSGQPRLLLMAAVHGSFDCAPSGYNVPEISKSVDYINVIMYNFRSNYETTVGHHAPLFSRMSTSSDERKLTTDYSAKAWVKAGAPKEKLLIGIPTFGRSFQLEDSNKFTVGSAAIQAGQPWKYTSTFGFMSYNEVCEFLERDDVTYVWDDQQQVPWAYGGADQWVGFEDVRSVKNKMNWLKRKGFGGVVVMSLDVDDYKGNCKKGKYPLINAMKQELMGYSVKLQSQDPSEPSVDKDEEASDKAAAENTTTDFEASGYDIPDNTTLDDTTSDIATSNNATSDIATPNNATSDIATSNNATLGIATPNNATSDITTSDSTASNNSTSNKATPDSALGSAIPITNESSPVCKDDEFRCDSKCFGKNKWCDGKADCSDSSDENSDVCKESNPTGCRPPSAPYGTLYVSGQCDPSDTSYNCIANVSSAMPFGSYLHLVCSDGYALLPDTATVMNCTASGEYIPSPPTTCLETCPSIDTFQIYQTHCWVEELTDGRSNNRTISCNQPLVAGTKVTLSCPTHYKNQNKIATCLKTGQWSLEPTITCQPYSENTLIFSD